MKKVRKIPDWGNFIYIILATWIPTGSQSIFKKGKSEYMRKVKEIMYTGNDNPTADKNCCFRDILEIMNSKKLGVVCIVDAGKLIGIVTDGDVRRLILKTQDTLPELFMKNIESIMNKNPKTVLPDTSFEDCLAQLGNFWVMPVVDKQKKLLGLVHLQTLLRAMVKSG